MTDKAKVEENCNHCAKMCFDMPLKERANCKKRITIQDLYDKIANLKKENAELRKYEKICDNCKEDVVVQYRKLFDENEQFEETVKKLSEENEHLRKSQEWHDASIFPRKEGDYLCEFSIGVFNYRHFWLPNVWGIDDEVIIRWQGEL